MLKAEATGIGSLPFTDPQAAVSHVFTSYSIPFFPQLVQHAHYKKTNLPQMLQEAVPAQILDVLLSDSSASQASLREKWRALIADHLAGLPALAEFLSRLRQYQGSLYKLQFCGPLTAARIIGHLTGRSPAPEVIAVMSEMFVETAQQLMRLTQEATSASCLFIWDEGLPLTEPSAAHTLALTNLLRSLESDQVQTGVHCCAPFHPAVFLPHAQKHWLAVDLTACDLTDASVVSALGQIRQSGGLIAGVVNTNTTRVHQDQVRKICAPLAAVAEPGGRSPFLISGGCGTGLRTEAFEQDLTKALKSASL